MTTARRAGLNALGWEQWIAMVEEDIREMSGLTLDDIGACEFGKMFELGFTPRRAAQSSLEMAEKRFTPCFTR